MSIKKTILINTCDAYSDVWYPFFRILENTWPQAKEYEIYLNTETKTYSDSYFDIKVLNILPGKLKNIAWGERLIDAIERIDSEYILMILEDFFFEKEVDEKKLNDCYEWFSKNLNIAAISLISTYDLKNLRVGNEEYSGFAIRKKRVYYTLTASPCLWKKTTLLKYTNKSDSPWVWERFGSIRTWFSKDIFIAKLQNTSDIFEYDILRGGAVHRGKWVGCTVKPLLKQYKINLDLNTRGMIEDWTKEKNVGGKKTISSILYNKYLTLQNLFIAVLLAIKERR